MSKPGFLDISLYGLPQEEVLEIKRHKKSLDIGVPKETCLQEKRVALSPQSVQLLVNNGHTVRIETGAGEGAHYRDMHYSDAGAEIVYTKEEVFRSSILLKVEPPSLDEIELMHPKQILISALQLKTQNALYFDALMKKKATALSYEGLMDEDGIVPIVRSMSEIAGSSAILIASEYLSNLKSGMGYLLGGVSGVPPTEVVIIGAGTVGTYAAKTAIALGATVKVFDKSISRLRRLQNQINAPVSTCVFQPNILEKALKKCEVAIGAVRAVDGRTPCLVSEEMVMEMKQGAVIIDVSIDQGGAFETSELTTHDKPTFVKHGIIHYCVPNIPSRVSRTASFSLSNVLSPLLQEIGERGGLEEILFNKRGVRSGLYLYNGVLTSKELGEYYNLPYTNAELLFHK